MRRSRAPSPQTLAVISVMAEEGTGEIHGYEIARRTGLASGTLYPLLMRLADRGLLESRWELPRSGGRPRHLYRLSPDGVEFARESRKFTAAASRPRLLGEPA